MAKPEQIELHRLESRSHSDKVVTLIEREMLRAGEQQKYSGRLGALRDIYATADRVALDIIADIRRNHDKSSKH